MDVSMIQVPYMMGDERQGKGPPREDAVSGQIRPCPSKRAIPGFSKTKQRAHTP